MKDLFDIPAHPKPEKPAAPAMPVCQHCGAPGQNHHEVTLASGAVSCTWSLEWKTETAMRQKINPQPHERFQP